MTLALTPHAGPPSSSKPQRSSAASRSAACRALYFATMVQSPECRQHTLASPHMRKMSLEGCEKASGLRAYSAAAKEKEEKDSTKKSACVRW
jgi:hypothetical protein